MDDQNNHLDQFVGMVLGTETRPPGSAEFVATIEAKLDFGIQKYGPGSWRRHDMISELLTELVDTFNYPYLVWRVMMELGVDRNHPQLFMRIEQACRRIALESFTQWATLTRLLATLDGLGVPRSVSGENQVGVQQTENHTDDGTDADRLEATSGDPAATGDAGGSGNSGSDGEVRHEPGDAAASEGPRHAAPRVRRQPAPSE